MRLLLASGVLLSSLATAGELPPIGLGLIRDVNSAVEPASSAPSNFTVVGDKAYFAAYRPESGNELFVSDGTAVGSRPFSDLLPGAPSSDPRPLGVAGGHLILRAGEYTNRQIWSVRLSDGIPRQLTTAVRPSSEPEQWTRAFAATANRLLFRLGDDAGLWSTDGAVAGTLRLPVDASFPLSYVWSGCSGTDQAILAGQTTGFDAAIVATDGTPTGSRVLADLTNKSSAIAIRSGALCYLLLQTFSGVSWELWRSDGTVGGTALIAQNGAYGIGIAALGDAFYIHELSLPQDRSRLVRVSAAEPSPVTIAEFTGTENRLSGLREVQGRLLFFQRNASQPANLYQSDGTAAGTRRVYPLLAGQSLRITEFYELPGAIVVEDADETVQIDLSNGGIAPGPHSSEFAFYGSVGLGDVRIGRGRGNRPDEELWSANGTLAGSRLIKDLWEPTADAVPAVSSEDWAIVDDVLILSGLAEPTPSWPSRSGILRSDGTPDGTYAVPRSVYDEHSVYGFAPLQDGVAFLSHELTGETVLYRATSALTSSTAIASGMISAFGIQSFAGAGGVLFGCSGLFTGVDLCSYSSATGNVPVGPEGITFDHILPIGQLGGVALFNNLGNLQIWRSDGTAPGTFPLASSTAAAFTRSAEFGGRLYFSGCLQGVCGLVAADGTSSGTSVLSDLAGGELRGIVALPGRVVFGVYRSGQSALWSTDGSAGGTQQLDIIGAFQPSEIAVAGGRAHIAAWPCETCGSTLLTTDGTVAGTRRIGLPAGLSANPRVMARLGSDIVVFGCTSTDRGTELCATDAEGLNVSLLPEILPGSRTPPHLQALAANSQGLFLSVDDTVHGKELWLLRQLPDTLFADRFEAKVGSP